MMPEKTLDVRLRSTENSAHVQHLYSRSGRFRMTTPSWLPVHTYDHLVIMTTFCGPNKSPHTFSSGNLTLIRLPRCNNCMTSGKLLCSVLMKLGWILLMLRKIWNSSKTSCTLKYFEALKVILASCFFCLSMWLFSSFSLPFPVLFPQIGYFECVIIY